MARGPTVFWGSQGRLRHPGGEGARKLLNGARGLQSSQLSAMAKPVSHWDFGSFIAPPGYAKGKDFSSSLPPHPRAQRFPVAFTARCSLKRWWWPLHPVLQAAARDNPYAAMCPQGTLRRAQNCSIMLTSMTTLGLTFATPSARSTDAPLWKPCKLADPHLVRSENERRMHHFYARNPETVTPKPGKKEETRRETHKQYPRPQLRTAPPLSDHCAEFGSILRSQMLADVWLMPWLRPPGLPKARRARRHHVVMPLVRANMAWRTASPHRLLQEAPWRFVFWSIQTHPWASQRCAQQKSGYTLWPPSFRWCHFWFVQWSCVHLSSGAATSYEMFAPNFAAKASWHTEFTSNFEFSLQSQTLAAPLPKERIQTQRSEQKKKAFPLQQCWDFQFCMFHSCGVAPSKKQVSTNWKSHQDCSLSKLI